MASEKMLSILVTWYYHDNILLLHVVLSDKAVPISYIVSRKSTGQFSGNFDEKKG